MVREECLRLKVRGGVVHGGVNLFGSELRNLAPHARHVTVMQGDKCAINVLQKA